MIRKVEWGRRLAQRDERGSVLVLAVLMIALFAMAGGTFLAISTSEGRIATNREKATQALYVAEAGAHVAYREFAASNFRGRTHNGDGTMASAGLLAVAAFQGGLTLDDMDDNGLAEERNDGWYVWEWNLGDDQAESLTGSGLAESFRFALRPASTDADEDEYIIDVIGSVGIFSRRLEVLGYTEPAFGYALYSDGDLSEFTRGVDQDISGKIHANGNLYFRPAGTVLSVDSPMITATGQMIRTEDAWGRPAPGGETVLIKDRDGNWVEMAGGGAGVAMDSNHPDWTNDDPDDGVDGALDLWDGIVRDGTLGATSVDPPPVETMEVGGYFDLRASLRIRAGDLQYDNNGNDISAWVGDAIQEVTFWNPSVDQYVTVQEIDLNILASGGNFPASGLIHSDVPLRVVNASQLENDLTIVADHSIYTKGSFNSVNKRAAALVSSGRIWHVSDAWQDDDAYTMAPKSSRQAANGTTEIHAAMVDGQPVVEEANYADLDGDGFPDDPGAGDTWANNDHLLESWGGSRTLLKRGSIVHMQFADMADNLNNAGILPEEVAWSKHAAYSPPHRDYGYDPSLAGMSGQPPYAPLVSRLFLWREVTP
ncbi:MAG: pilus assembly PilX N-terminal domain-containing protein [Gemmatimonadota bacterium]|nr:pilus assembly PilX N-terminal domain-containing protein [Gemmatimonadota bacterium]